MAVKGLELVIKLTDQISKPLRSITEKVDNFTNKVKSSMGNIAFGAAGIVAVGASMKAALDPAIDFQRALSNIEAVGMKGEGLDKIKRFALDFSSSYGVSSVEVVNSVNEIARAVDGLTDDELIAFANSANIMAKATGSSMEEMGGYLSQMYGIFDKQAEAMGKTKWAEDMAAKATLTANMFKSSGKSLADAFTNLTSLATVNGVKIEEQFGVLGTLQNVMPGGQSGTAYKSFINGVVGAQKKLGMTFLDQKGKMLPIVTILEKIKKKYGDIDAKELKEISKAFGGNDAGQVVAHLSKNLDGLADNIQRIGKAKNLEEAMRISKTVTDVWQRFSNILTNIAIAIGGQLLNKITPYLNRIADIGQGFTNWLSTYKNIARWIGYLLSGLMGFAAVGPVIMLLKGVFGLWWGSMKGAWGVIVALSKAIKLNIILSKLWAATLWLVNGVMKVIQVAAKLMWVAMTGPIGLVIAAIVMIGYVIYSNWEKIKGWGLALWEWLKQGWAAFLETLSGLWNGFNTFFGVLWEGIKGTINGVWDFISSGWRNTVGFFSELSPMNAFKDLGNGLVSIFTEAYDGLKNKLISLINWMIEKLNNLPGVEIDLLPTAQNIPGNPTERVINPMVTTASSVTALAGFANGALDVTTPPPLALPQSVKPDAQVKSGLVTKNMTTNQDNSKHVNIGSVVVNEATNLQQILQAINNKAELAA